MTGDLVVGGSIARNLLVAYSHLVAHVWPSLRLDIYRKCVSVFTTALQLTGENKHLLWSSAGKKGTVEVFRGLVNRMGAELLPLAAAAKDLVIKYMLTELYKVVRDHYLPSRILCKLFKVILRKIIEI